MLDDGGRDILEQGFHGSQPHEPGQAILPHFYVREGWTWRNEFELGKSRAMRGELYLKEYFQTVLDFRGHATLDHAADPSVDQRANPSRETIQGAEGGHLKALFDEFLQGRVDHIRRVVHRAHRT